MSALQAKRSQPFIFVFFLRRMRVYEIAKGEEDTKMEILRQNEDLCLYYVLVITWVKVWGCGGDDDDEVVGGDDDESGFSGGVIVVEMVMMSMSWWCGGVCIRGRKGRADGGGWPEATPEMGGGEVCVCGGG
ncbi:hypothetical protein Tco_0639204 [Tanacetum coccineum]